MRVNLKRVKFIWLLIGLVTALTYISYGLSKNNQAHTFHLLWEETIRPEAKPAMNPQIRLEANYVTISINYDDDTSIFYRLFLYNDSGLVWKKRIKGGVYGHEIARDGKHILIYLCKQGSCLVQLYSIKGKLLWESKDHSYYRFSADGKHLVTSLTSEEDFFKEFAVFDFKGRILWKKKFEEYLLDGVAFNNGRDVLIRERGSGKTYFFDTKKGLLWERDFGVGVEHKVSEDGELILAIEGAGDILFSVIDLKGNILFEGKESMRLSEKEPFYLPSFLYKNKVFIEGRENDYLLDIKGNVEAITIRSDFIRQLGLDQKERERILLSPNLRYLLCRPKGGMVLKYYRID